MRNSLARYPVSLAAAVVSLFVAGPLLADMSRGMELYKQKKFPAAAGEFQQVLERDAKNQRALTYLGLSRAQSGQAAKALEPLNKAVSLNGKDPEAHYGLGLAYGYLKKTDKAIASLKRACELKPDHAYAHYNLGMAYNQTKKKDLSIKHLRRFLELAPEAQEAKRVKAFLSRIG